LKTRRFDLTFANPGGPLDASVTIDERARLVRLDIPSASLSVVRDDASSVAMRQRTVRNPTDADVTIPANGFNLAGTLTTPPGVADRLRSPGVVLVGGSGPTDRDETVAGIPIFAQFAKQLADSGYVVFRYDKRGVGQSGGRTETATLSDYAEDVIAVAKWMAKRKDIDPRKVIVAGHSEGGAVALMAAGREGKIKGVVSMAAPGSKGDDLILEQQSHVLDVMKVPEAEKQAKIDLQKKIQAAVTAGSGWEGIPDELRKQADTPWFKSVLTFEPAAVMTKIKQPILILHADLDPNVPPSEADKLGDLAKARKKAPPSEVVHLPELTHALTPAGSNAISPKAAEIIAAWIKKQ
jgi:hypothetical protein